MLVLNYIIRPCLDELCNFCCVSFHVHSRKWFFPGREKTKFVLPSFLKVNHTYQFKELHSLIVSWQFLKSIPLKKHSPYIFYIFQVINFIYRQKCYSYFSFNSTLCSTCYTTHLSIANAQIHTFSLIELLCLKIEGLPISHESILWLSCFYKIKSLTGDIFNSL